MLDPKSQSYNQGNEEPPKSDSQHDAIKDSLKSREELKREESQKKILEDKKVDQTKSDTDEAEDQNQKEAGTKEGKTQKSPTKPREKGPIITPEGGEISMMDM